MKKLVKPNSNELKENQVIALTGGCQCKSFVCDCEAYKCDCQARKVANDIEDDDILF